MVENKNSYNYQLTTPTRGVITIRQSDPRNNALDIAKLEATYGKGNVKVVSDLEFVKESGILATAQTAITSLSNEIITPLDLASSNVFSGLAVNPNPDQFTLNPPTNVSVVGNTAITDNLTGNPMMQVTVQFDDLAGVDYLVTYVPLNAAVGPSTVNVTSGPTVSGKTISVSWSATPNTINYVISAVDGSGNTYYASAPITGTSGSVTVPSSGQYTLYIYSYNSYGISGTPYSTSVSVV